jgi:perosamine synthetase
VYKGKPLGTHGPSAVFAFYANKQMTTGEGGIVTTHSEEEWRLLRSLRNQGRGDAGGWLEHVRLGYNYRLSDVACALGLGQVEKLDEILPRRAQAAHVYDDLLRDVAGVELPAADDGEHVRSWFVYVVALPDNATRERAIAHFEREGIGFNRYLPSIHLQPYMRERYGFREGMCPVSEDLSSRTLALPFFTALEREQQERVAEVLAAALA